MILRILLLISIAFNTFAATTKAQAIKIFNKIVEANHMVVHPKLVFSNDKEVNAYCYTNYIIVNRGMLDVTNINELALVLGHELGHYKLHHTISTPANEFAADKKGYYYAVKAGYDAHKGKELFKKFKQQGSDTHPNPRDRYRALP